MTDKEIEQARAAMWMGATDGGLSYHDAEDLVQECLIRKMSDPLAHSYWTARQRSWKMRRSQSRKNRIECVYVNSKRRHDEAVDRRLDVGEAIAQLKPKQRDVVVRRFWKGEDVSARGATSQDRHQNASARKRLRQLLCSYRD